MMWYETEDQKLIDETLAGYIAQGMAIHRDRVQQRAILTEDDETWWCEPCPIDIIRDYNDLCSAGFHTSRDIDILRPQSSVPF